MSPKIILTLYPSMPQLLLRNYRPYSFHDQAHHAPSFHLLTAGVYGTKSQDSGPLLRLA